MQIKCGTDLIQIERISRAIRRLGRSFLDRIWSAEEQADCLAAKSSVDGVSVDLNRGIGLTAASASSLAARFAAKEAVAKALGTGIGPLGVCWTDIVIHRGPGSQGDSCTEIGAGMTAPLIILKGGALHRYRQMGGISICISLSHESGLALAYCVLLHDSNATANVNAPSGA